MAVNNRATQVGGPVMNKKKSDAEKRQEEYNAQQRKTYRYGIPKAENDMGGGVTSTIFNETKSAGSAQEASQMAEQAASTFYGRETTGGYAPLPQVHGVSNDNVQQQPQSQQEEQKKAPLLAKIGVAPAVIVANLISKGLSALTGGKLDLGTQSIEDFASRPIGQVLGYATVATGAILGGQLLAGLIPAGASASETATLTELAAKPATLPNVVKTALTKNGIIMKVLSSTTGKLIVGGSIIAVPEKMQSDAKKAIASSRTSLSLIQEGYKAGGLSYGEAVEAIDMVESQINSYDRSMKMWGSVSLIDLLGGSKDGRVDAENARTDVLIARQQLNQQVVNQAMGNQ